MPAAVLAGGSKFGISSPVQAPARSYTADFEYYDPATPSTVRIYIAVNEVMQQEAVAIQHPGLFISRPEIIAHQSLLTLGKHLADGCDYDVRLIKLNVFRALVGDYQFRVRG